MRLEYMKELSTIVDLPKAGNSIPTDSITDSLRSGLKCLKRLMIIGVTGILRKLSDSTGDLLDRYDRIIKSACDIDLGREIEGLERALESLYILVDKAYVNPDEKYVNDAVLDLWRIAWYATCLLLYKDPEMNSRIC